MDTQNLLTSHSRTNLFKFSSMKRIVGEWNRLPLDIREASSEADFKLKVSTFLTIFNKQSFCKAILTTEKVIYYTSDLLSKI